MLERHIEFEINTTLKEKVIMGIPWQSSGYDLLLSLLLAWVQSLVRKLRSHKPYSVAKKKEKKKEKASG